VDLTYNTWRQRRREEGSVCMNAVSVLLLLFLFVLLPPLLLSHLDILPVLLEKRSQEVAGQLDVQHDIILVHGDIAHRHIQTHDLLHLELDGGTHL